MPKAAKVIRKAATCKVASIKITSLKKLQEQRDAVECLARRHALQTAIAYYGVREDVLREVVFANWLHDHAFTENFQPMKWSRI